MKQRFLFLLKFYLILLGIFFLDKVVFMLYNGFHTHGAEYTDIFPVLFNGLPLDFATAGYLTAPLWLILGLSLWFRIPKFRLGYLIYSGIISALLALILLSDICLYKFWDIKLDGTVFNYLDSPKGIVASVSTLYIVTVVVVFLLVAFTLFDLLRHLFPE